MSCLFFLGLVPVEAGLVVVGVEDTDASEENWEVGVGRACGVLVGRVKGKELDGIAGAACDDSTDGENGAATDDRLVVEIVVEVCKSIAEVITEHEIAGEATEDESEDLRTAIRRGRLDSGSSTIGIWTVPILVSARDLL